jgi:hypothetical protein
MIVWDKCVTEKSAEQRQLELIALSLTPWAIPISLSVTPLEPFISHFLERLYAVFRA